jgi:excisionase family DNA binding protein
MDFPDRIPAPPPEAVNVPTAGFMLGGITRGHVYRLIRAGKLKTVKLGRRRVVPVSAIRELLERAAA